MSGKPAAHPVAPTACPEAGRGTHPIATGSPGVLFDGKLAVVDCMGNHGHVVAAGSGTALIDTIDTPAAFILPNPQDWLDHLPRQDALGGMDMGHGA